MENRSKIFDVIKFIAIFLVVWGHAIMCIDHQFQKKLVDIIYSFHMPLFMTISGYFASNSFNRPVREFTYRKFIQLLLPALAWSIIEVAWHYSLGTGYSLRDSFIGNSWFLKTLFAIFVVVYLLKKTHINDWVLFSVSCAIFFAIPNASTLKFNEMYFYFWIGYFMKKYPLNIKAMTTCSLICLFLFVYLYCIRDYFEFIHWLPMTINTIQSDTATLAINYSLGFTGTITVIYGLQSVEHLICNCRIYDLMAKFGRYTLQIYVLQTFFLIFGMSALVGQPQTMASGCIICIIVSVFTIACSITTTHILDRISMVSTILFGKLSFSGK